MTGCETLLLEQGLVHPVPDEAALDGGAGSRNACFYEMELGLQAARHTLYAQAAWHTARLSCASDRHNIPTWLPQAHLQARVRHTGIQ